VQAIRGCSLTFKVFFYSQHALQVRGNSGEKQMTTIWQPLKTITIGTAFCLTALTLAGCASPNKCESRAAICDEECPRCALCENKSRPCAACLAKWRQRCDRETCSHVYLPTGHARDSVLKIEKCGPRRVRAGEPFKYTIRVTNRTDHALRNVVVVDELPQNVTVEAPAPGTVGWTPQERLAGASASNVVRYAIGDLCPKETRCIEQCGTACGSGCISTCLTAYYDLFACVQTSVTQPKLCLDMTGPREVFICHCDEEALVRLSVRNPGSGQADNVRVTVSMTMPPGATQLAASGETERTVGDLGCGEERNLDLCLQVPQPGEYRVVAQAVGDNGLCTEPRELQFVARYAHLNIQAAGPEHEMVGLPIEYRIMIGNTGNAPDTNVVVSAEMPPGTLFMGASDDGQPAGDRVVWNIGNFPPGQPREFLLHVRTADVACDFSPVFTICGDCGGQQTATVCTALEGVPSLLLEMIDIQDPLRVGEEVQYKVTVTNQGSAPEMNIRLAARVPDEMTFVRSTGPTEPRVEGAELTFAPLPVLAPKNNATWSIFARCNRPANVRMAVQVQSDQDERPIRETEATHVY
jgi:uncharacterized repeat protein (TIGR01451 family)